MSISRKGRMYASANSPRVGSWTWGLGASRPLVVVGAQAARRAAPSKIAAILVPFMPYLLVGL
jgi:hypothetical protein